MLAAECLKGRQYTGAEYQHFGYWYGSTSVPSFLLSLHLKIVEHFGVCP